jgi:hypothetical protein
LRIWSTIVESWVAGRLVGDQDHRPVDEGTGDRDPLLLTTGELLGQSPSLSVQAHQVEHLGDHPLDGGRGLADDLQGEGHVLGHRLVGQQPEVLEDGADLAAHRGDLPAVDLVQLPPRDEHLAPRRPQLAQDQTQEGGLARARSAHQEHELALFDLDVDVGQGRSASGVIALGHAFETNHSKASAGVDNVLGTQRGAGNGQGRF